MCLHLCLASAPSFLFFVMIPTNPTKVCFHLNGIQLSSASSLRPSRNNTQVSPLRRFIMRVEKEISQLSRATFRYIAATDSGELLNRFSQDMELIDMDLLATLVNYTSSTPP